MPIHSFQKAFHRTLRELSTSGPWSSEKIARTGTDLDRRRELAEFRYKALRAAAKRRGLTPVEQEQVQLMEKLHRQMEQLRDVMRV